MGVAIPNRINFTEWFGGRDSEQIKMQKNAWGSRYRTTKKCRKSHGGRDSEKLNIHKNAWGSRFRTAENEKKRHVGRNSEQLKNA